MKLSLAVARRYAKALVNIVAMDEELDFEETGLTLRKIKDGVVNIRGFQLLLNNPKILFSKKWSLVKELIEKVGASQTVENFLRLLVERGRMSDLGVIVQAYEELANEARNIVDVRVRSAFPLSPEEKEKIREKISMKKGKDVVLHEEVVPDMIGGLIIQIGSEVYDGSVSKQLELLREELIRG